MKHWGMNNDMHFSCASELQGRLYMCSKYFPFLIFSFPIHQMRTRVGPEFLNMVMKVVLIS